jgi:hypothetical protein
MSLVQVGIPAEKERWWKIREDKARFSTSANHTSSLLIRRGDSDKVSLTRFLVLEKHVRYLTTTTNPRTHISVNEVAYSWLKSSLLG